MTRIFTLILRGETFKLSSHVAMISLALVILVVRLKIPTLKFMESEFMFGFLAIFLGLAFPIVTHIHSMIDKIKINIEKYFYLDNDKDNLWKIPTDAFRPILIRTLTDSLFSESRKNEDLAKFNRALRSLYDILWAIFVLFVIIILVMLWEAIDISYIYVPEKLIFTKISILKSVKIVVFFHSMFLLGLLIVSNKDYMNYVMDREPLRHVFLKYRAWDKELKETNKTKESISHEMDIAKEELKNYPEGSVAYEYLNDRIEKLRYFLLRV